MGENIIEELFDYLLDKYNNNGKDYKKYKESELDLDRQFGNYIERYEDLYNNEGNIPKVIVRDYIAGMTDNYALNAMKQIKIPKPIHLINNKLLMPLYYQFTENRRRTWKPHFLIEEENHIPFKIKRVY